MTEKRFRVSKVFELNNPFPIYDRDCPLTQKEASDLLNELAEESEQLKQFKEKVFVLLDEKIKHYGHKPFSAPVGQPMSVNFDADVDRIARLSELQDLKKELQE